MRAPHHLMICGAALAGATVAAAAAAPLPLLFCAAVLVPYGTGALLLAKLHARHRSGHAFGAANAITLARLSIACLATGLTAVALQPAVALTPASAWVACGIGVVSLICDGVDGLVARRTGGASPFGARFDMEVDAYFILVLAVLAWATGKVGAWVLLSGAARYVYVAAAMAWDVLRIPLLPSFRRKAIAVIQGAALVALIAPLVQPPASEAIAATALALLLYSFAADIRWQVAVAAGRLAPAS
jgi:phosphatidylglycerophosphate synthase